MTTTTHLTYLDGTISVQGRTAGPVDNPETVVLVDIVEHDGRRTTLALSPDEVDTFRALLAEAVTA